MSASKVSIVNAALIHLGQETIASLTDNNKRARVMNQRFDAIRDRTMRAHPWRFALKRTNLSAVSVAPEYNWSYAYNQPSDCLRVLRIKDMYEPWIKEGNKILTDQPGPLYIQYIQRVDTASQYDASYIEYLAVELAIATCVSLTNNRKLITEVLVFVKEDVLFEARSAGAMEGWPDEHYDDGSWVTVRD